MTSVFKNQNTIFQLSKSVDTIGNRFHELPDYFQVFYFPRIGMVTSANQVFVVLQVD